MTNSLLLDLAWQGALRPASGAAEHRVQHMLAAVLPVTTISLTATRGLTETLVQPEEIELMPALSLGDVLAEELGLDLPYGILVAISPANATFQDDDASLSHHVGILVGTAILSALHSGIFPLTQESDALSLVACAYGRLATLPRAKRGGLVASAFDCGLAEVLADYWAYNPGPSPSLLSGMSCHRQCHELHGPQAGQLDPVELHCPEKVDHEQWLLMLGRAVRAALADKPAPALSRRSI